MEGLSAVQSLNGFAGAVERLVDIFTDVIRSAGASAPTPDYIRGMNERLRCFEGPWIEHACRWKWRDATAETAADLFVAEVARRCRDANVRALTGRGIPRALAHKAVVGGDDLDRLRAELTMEIETLTDLAKFEPDDALERIAARVSVLSNEMDIASLSSVAEHARSVLRRFLTPEIRALFVKMGWKAVTMETVDTALQVDVTNRAVASLACLIAHGRADKYAIDGLVAGKQPRAIGLENTYGLQEPKVDPHATADIRTMRKVLATCGWRGADTEDDVDMRFGRLVTERAAAIAGGARDFVGGLGQQLPVAEREAAEKAFRLRFRADYDAMRVFIGAQESYLIPAVEGFVVKPTEDAAVDKIVSGVLKRHAWSVAEMYPDGLPKDDGDLEKIANHLKIVGDFTAHARPVIVASRWRGLTEETVDLAVAKMFLIAARTYQDPEAQPTRLHVLPNGEIQIYGLANGETPQESDDLTRHCLAVDAGWEARVKPVAQGPTPPRAQAPRWAAPKGFDDYLMALGVRFWNETYKQGMTDDEARVHITAAAQNTDGMPPEHPTRAEGAALAHFAAKWAVHAFQRMQTSHTFAAAMMATHTSPECADDLEIPWSAFMVHVPNGLLVVGPNEYSRLLCVTYEDVAELHMVAANSPEGGAAQLRTASLAELLLDDPKPTTALERASLLARRLITGLLFARQNKRNSKERVVRASRSFREGRRHEEPEHRIVVVGHPLTIDCREAIASYLQTGRYERLTPGGEGGGVRRGPPVVQTLVEGHRKQQVCGVGRHGRKTIWVESYWRGPKGAAILTKPKRIIGKPKNNKGAA
jgi:hypothetical protein